MERDLALSQSPRLGVFMSINEASALWGRFKRGVRAGWEFVTFCLRM